MPICLTLGQCCYMPGKEMTLTSTYRNAGLLSPFVAATLFKPVETGSKEVEAILMGFLSWRKDVVFGFRRSCRNILERTQ